MNRGEGKWRKKAKELEKENRELKMEKKRLQKVAALLQKENDALKKRIRRMEGEGGVSQKRYMVKPSVKGEKKRPGRKRGHVGTSRRRPERCDEVIRVKCSSCPHCGWTVGDPVEVKRRVVEDITLPKSRVTVYETERYFCSRCGKVVSARTEEALPACRLGVNVTLLAVYMKYGLHLPLDKIRENFEICFGIKTTKTTIYNHMRLLSQYYAEEFEEIKRQIKESEAVYADETGWRINGVNQWLWAFVTQNAALFKIDRRRSSDVPKEVLGEDFRGVLVSDFYAAYNGKLHYRKQKCLIHFLRDTHEISQNNEETQKFHESVKRFVHEAAALKEAHLSQPEIAEARKRFQKKLTKIITKPYTDCDCIRLAKRLKQHRDSLLTFLEVESVDHHNNRAERAVRPHVLIRKISGGNKSEAGAEIHERLTSIIETCKLKKRNFLKESAEFMRNALRQRATSQN